ncbi:amino acid ABC transporter substrate-binding protein (PAAT family) [Rhodoglobus vestalii]|uniref:Amino acid ABC transporter substrate-binding protein (PAAT family) n=1 Tax=Rhodoglobus vestalii TaxID=193384 RepID=A0A8H2K4M4_9MICO|nr:transporter substrate-binding domain-containing protein [Rhodoglobus vestalii]TQO18807.1 amino acid ABC transporter substrate-binding protein (PAAT family) [Rhodoglobus vestalii]
MALHSQHTHRALVAAAILATSALFTAGCSPASDSGESADATDTAVEVAGVAITVDNAARAALPQKYSDAGSVKVATDVPYAPFEMFESEGSDVITGVDYDLGQAIGAKLGIDFDFEQQKFDGIIPALQAGKVQVAISAMTSSVDRMDVLTFVDYSASGTGILVEKGNPAGIETYLDLCGQKLAVQSGASQIDLVAVWQDECSSAGKGAIALSEYPKDSDAQLAITSGKVIASVLTKPSAGFVAKTANDGNTFEVIDDPAAPTGYDSTLNGIGVLNADAALADAIQLALQSLMDDGTYMTILEAYGVEGIAIEAATINAAKS